MRSALAFMMGDSNDPVQFIATGGDAGGSAAVNVVLPPTVYPGHLMVVNPYGQAPTSGSGVPWEATEFYGSNDRAYYKVLTAADLAAPVRIASGGVWCVYRGASTLVRRTMGYAVGAGPTLPGFIKSPQARGLLYVAGGDGNTAQPAIGSPGTTRAKWNLVSGASPTRSLGDILPASAYTDGAAIPTSGSSNGATWGAIFELHP